MRISSTVYTERTFIGAQVGCINFTVLDETSRLSLEREFTKEEIFKGLIHFGRDKASGPDSFNMGFL